MQAAVAAPVGASGAPTSDGGAGTPKRARAARVDGSAWASSAAALLTVHFRQSLLFLMIFFVLLSLLFVSHFYFVLLTILTEIERQRGEGRESECV